jgi:hypothetical protein
MMLKIPEELLILKMTVKGYEEALAKSDVQIMMELAVDIAESAEKLEKLTFDHANKIDAE